VFRLGIIKRLGRSATIRANVETDGRANAAFQDSGGRGIGAWTVSGAVDRIPGQVAVNANGTYVANRAELGIAHIATYDSANDRLADERTSLRLGTSIAFADGSLAIGRPILDGFLLATTHRTLGGAAVRLDPDDRSENARSGTFGPAVANDLSPYSSRTVIYDVPEAPAGYDLGQGNVQIVPPYRAGYRLVVGSDYNLLVTGRLIRDDGDPVSLLAGSATEIAHPKRPPVAMFTARDGRFAIQGLRPGRWHLIVPDRQNLHYEFVVTESANGIAVVGTLKPGKITGDDR
jgi:outer membrane usher protein